MIIATDAIVLRQIPYSESSIICRLFTKKEGKITIIAKGARRPKYYISGLLEPINYISILYYNKNNRAVQILKEASYAMHFHNIRKSYKKIIYTLTAIEIIDKTYLNEEPSPIIFRLLVKYLNYKISGSLKVAETIDKSGFFIGNYPKNLQNELNI